MNLARNDSSQNLGMEIICDDAGTEFPTGTERETYVTNFYSDLYKTRSNGVLPENCIEEFLGTAGDHEAVINSKLSNDEKAELDSELSINELDEAVKQIKMNSSPGIDGISNKFIKKFWEFFRTPLYNYTQTCLNKGTLTETFRVAKVRLIPKKGDIKKISNWRPISLLNCFYKLVSRVITNRIRKYSDKITQVGQMGYSKTKCCQEVAIKIFDTIFGLKNTQKNGCIVSVDIKKAFDSLSHDFMEKALTFFNFGPKIISWIKTICTGRKACIIFSDGKMGKVFDLERGNAQGDVISPFIFNICYQILLLKVECELQIKKVDLPDIDLCTRETTGAIPTVSHHSKKVFAFADDCNIICLLEKNSIELILQILNDFAKISGLECNVQKSNIVAIGHEPVVTEELKNIGFNFVEEIMVLGFRVSNSDRVIDDNTKKLSEKVLMQSRIWSRFNLSLPGRISICKSMFYSQLNYIGGTLPVNGDVCGQIQEIIYRYVSGNLNISKQRAFSPVNHGGLGLFPVSDFLNAQKCGWIKRCKTINQDWKVILINSGTGNIAKITHRNVDKEIFPVLHSIAEAFSKFIKEFTKLNLNYTESYLLNNEALTIGIRSHAVLVEADLLTAIADPDPHPLPAPVQNRAAGPENLQEVLHTIRDLKIKDLYVDNRPVTKVLFQRGIGTILTTSFWEKLDKIRRAATTRYGADQYKPRQCVLNFINSWKTGSKRIRNIITNDPELFIPHNIMKFAENTEIIIGSKLGQKLNEDWNKHYLSNDMRVFIFKLHNNTLPINIILSHFVAGIGRNCTFCDITLNPFEEEETILHLFYDCATSEALREHFFYWITNDRNFTAGRREFFGVFRLANNF
jgi:Reverse transcriptase (RNA-dependent DNA polymerase)